MRKSAPVGSLRIDGFWGYAFIKLCDGSWQRYHRYLMEKRLKRKLRRSEIVHHIDGNKLNNRLRNLEITDRSRHAAHHITGRKVSAKTRLLMKLATRRRVKDPGYLAKLSSRVKVQHAAGNFGRSTWKRPRKITSKVTAQAKLLHTFVKAHPPGKDPTLK